MIVHVMPTYACNQNCCYCYLKNNNTNKSTVLDLHVLNNRLSKINTQHKIERINVYGGEITLLDKKYLRDLFSICSYYATVSATTNLSGSTSFSPVTDSISYYKDFNIHWNTSINDERPNNKETFFNLLTLDKKIGVTQVVTPSLLKEEPAHVLKRLSMICKSVEFLIYSPSISNSLYNLTNKDYEDFLIKILSEKNRYGVYIQNEKDIVDCIENKYNSYLDSNLFIDPNGDYAYIAYKNGKEYFKKSANDLSDYYMSVKDEKKYWNKKCSKCKYIGHCYAEHLKEWKEGDTCCGMYNLLEYYRQNIYKNN